MVFLLVGCVGYTYYNKPDGEPIETDYKALVHLNQAPDSQPREPNHGDIDTGVTGYVQGIPVRMYASRTWANDDYGKTFLWRDN